MSVKPDAYKFLLGFDYRTDPKVMGPLPLKEWNQAPPMPGIYEIGLGATKFTFVPKYFGKAVRQTLRQRLHQHHLRSSNTNVESNKPNCFFTCRPVQGGPTQRIVINNIEGLYLIAFCEQYIWNARQEWIQHWSVENASDT